MRLVGATTIVLMTITFGHVGVALSTQAAARFEVVSIRPVADSSFRLSEAGQTLLHIAAGRQLVGRADLTGIITFAYGVEPYERVVATEPSASRSLREHFEIRALPPESASPPSREAVKAMTRQMLAERFGLRVRIDTEMANAMVLRTIKPGASGPGLRPASAGCAQLPPMANPYDERFAEAYRQNCGVTFFGRIRGTATLDEFARAVSRVTRRAIQNRTDLEGMFSIDVVVSLTSLRQDAPSRFGAPSLDPTGQNEGPAFVDALRDQMGLSARMERQPIRLFVVEHVGPLVEN